MSGLTAWFFSGRRFDDGLGCLRRIGGGRQRGVGSVLFKLFFEDANTLGQRGQLLLQACDDLITLPTSKTRGFVQTRILWMKRASSSPRGRNRLNGYGRLYRAGAYAEPGGVRDTALLGVEDPPHFPDVVEQVRL